MIKETIKIYKDDRKENNNELLGLYIQNLYNENILLYKKPDDMSDEEALNISKNRAAKVLKVIFEGITRCLRAEIYSIIEDKIELNRFLKGQSVIFNIIDDSIVSDGFDNIIASAQLLFKNNKINYTLSLDSGICLGEYGALCIGRAKYNFATFLTVSKYHFLMDFANGEVLNKMITIAFKTIKEYLSNSKCEIKFPNVFKAKLTKGKYIIKPIGYNKFIIDDLNFIFSNYIFQKINVIKNLQEVKQ